MTSTHQGVSAKGSWLAWIAELLAMIIVAATVATFAILSNIARAGDTPGIKPSAVKAAVAAHAGAKSTPAVKTRPRRSSPYHAVSMSSRARIYYLSVWGVDDLLVHRTASGSLIRFTYRVVNPARAKSLADKRSTPYMYGERSHALLHVPVMEQVGPLRQSTPPKEGKEYWMVFSNKGNFVRVGDRVDVVIGPVHVDGLLVE